MYWSRNQVMLAVQLAVGGGKCGTFSPFYGNCAAIARPVAAAKLSDWHSGGLPACYHGTIATAANEPLAAAGFCGAGVPSRRGFRLFPRPTSAAIFSPNLNIQ